MSMIINAPTAKVATYNVAGQTDVQFNFDFDPTAMRADGTTLIVEYEGSEIRLENFFDADGNSLVENFLTQDGQAFSAAEFLAAIMGTEGGNTAEDIETAAGAAAGGSGAGDYSDDAGNLYDGLDALGGQGDAYDRTEVERLDEVPGTTLPGGDNEIVFDSDQRWHQFYDDAGNPWFDRAEYAYRPEEDPTANGINPIKDSLIFDKDLRNMEPIEGTGAVDTLILPDDPYGVALRLEDNVTPDLIGTPGLVDVEIIQGGSGSDIIDLSSTNFDYGDVTIDGGGGNDYIWSNIGNDLLNGGDGNDNMIGGIGNDTLYGDAGNDTMKGSVGDDLLNGGDGNDHIFGGEDNDQIDGGGGNDVIHGGAGNDQLNGGEGIDQINAGTGEHDVVTLGADQDRLIIDGDSLISTPDTDGPGGAGSMVEVTDFTVSDDQIDLNGYDILDAEVNGGDLALLVGNTAGTEHTWIVLDGVAPADLANVSVVDCGNWDSTTSPETLAQFVAGLA